MAFPVASRKAQFVSCPRAFAASSYQGQVMAVAVSAVPGIFSVATGIAQAPLNRQTADDPKSLTRNYVTIECDVDLAVIFGPTSASVSAGAANAPVIATVGTLSGGGVYTGVQGTAFVIYAKQPTRFLLQDQVDLFLGFVASGAGTMRLYQSSSDLA